MEYYKVGGCVRDAIMGVKSKDIDYTVVGESFAAMRADIEKRGGKIFVENEEFLTIRANVPNMGACDFVLARKDGDYSDGRRPDTVEMGTLEDDLARRDFTMNAIAQDEDGNIIDPYNGRFDIGRRVIVCVGNPTDRFSDDYLRMLRAVRFAVTKEMQLCGGIKNAIKEQYRYIRKVSVERVREELHKAFMHDTVRTFYLLQELKLLEEVFDWTPMRLKPTLEK